MGIKTTIDNKDEEDVQDDDSFEFDVQAEDIYDLTVFWDLLHYNTTLIIWERLLLNYYK